MRLIDADGLHFDIKVPVGTSKNLLKEIAWQTKKQIENAPTLTLDDLRPNGTWNIVEIDKVANRIVIECPECGMVEEMSLSAYGMGHNFCHSCGADMRGEVNG